MSTETEWICPICHGGEGDIAYVIPCCHQFCRDCILRWAQMKPQCALCRGRIERVKICAPEGADLIEVEFTAPEESPDVSSQEEAVPGYLVENIPDQVMVTPPSSPEWMGNPDDEGQLGPEFFGGLLYDVWAALFRRHQHLFDLVLPWLRLKLEEIYGADERMARSAESSIRDALNTYGPDEEMLVPMLWPIFERETAELVHELVTRILSRCGDEAWWLMHTDAYGVEEEDNPAARSSSFSSRWETPYLSWTSSSRSADSDGEEGPSTSEAVLRESPSHTPFASIRAEQEQSQEEQEQFQEEQELSQGELSTSQEDLEESEEELEESPEELEEAVMAAGPSGQGEEEPSTSEAVHPESPSHTPFPSVPAEQEQSQEQQEDCQEEQELSQGELEESQEELEESQEGTVVEEAVVAAGPSGQGCSHSPSAPSQDRDHSPREPRRAPKRRAPSSEASTQPCKRPGRRWH